MGLSDMEETKSIKSIVLLVGTMEEGTVGQSTAAGFPVGVHARVLDDDCLPQISIIFTCLPPSSRDLRRDQQPYDSSVSRRTLCTLGYVLCVG